MSLDIFRVGAVEQWRRHAERSGFPFDVANPGTFHRVAHSRTDDRLLVDTAARGAGEQHATLVGCVQRLREVGGVVHAPLGSDLPLTCLCDGARVPEDIHDAAVDKSLDAIFPEQA